MRAALGARALDRLDGDVLMVSTCADRHQRWRLAMPCNRASAALAQKTELRDASIKQGVLHQAWRANA